VIVTDLYKRQCALTSSHLLRVLDAAHIRPYSEGGTHSPSNGRLLRQDVHRTYSRFLSLGQRVWFPHTGARFESTERWKGRCPFHRSPIPETALQRSPNSRSSLERELARRLTGANRTRTTVSCFAADGCDPLPAGACLYSILFLALWILARHSSHHRVPSLVRSGAAALADPRSHPSSTHNLHCSRL
jgi:hypothetical protein